VVLLNAIRSEHADRLPPSQGAHRQSQNSPSEATPVGTSVVKAADTPKDPRNRSHDGVAGQRGDRQRLLEVILPDMGLLASKVDKEE